MSRSVSSHCALPYVYVRPVELVSKYPSLLRLYQQAKDQFWLPQDVQYDVDAIEWTSHLSESERHLLTRILAFMTVAYGSLYDNMLERFSREVNVLEARFFYEFQTVMQNIHTESIARAVQCIIPNARQRQEVLNSSIMLSSASRQTDWATKWLQGESFSLSERMTALVFAKAIFFHSGYAVLEWFKQQGRMPGLSTLNQLIAGDAALHTEFACRILKDHEELPDTVFAHNLVDEAVNVETCFIEDAFSLLSIPNLHASTLVEFVQFIADETLRSLGYNIRFNARNTMPFAVAASIPISVNFDGTTPDSDSQHDEDIPEPPIRTQQLRSQEPTRRRTLTERNDDGRVNTMTLTEALSTAVPARDSDRADISPLTSTLAIDQSSIDS